MVINSTNLYLLSNSNKHDRKHYKMKQDVGIANQQKEGKQVGMIA